MEIEKYFKAGSESYIQASEALNLIKKAREAGLNEDADRMQQGLEQSAQLFKQTRKGDGFRAQLKNISTLAPSINKFREQNVEGNNLVSSIQASIDLIRSSGGKVEQPTIDAITAATKNRDVAQLRGYNEALGSYQKAATSEMIKQMNTPKSATQIAGEQATSDEIDKANRQVALIDKYVTKDKNGKVFPTDTLKSITGVGEGIQNFTGRYIYGGAGNDPRQRSEQDDLMREVVLPDVLETVQYLKPASDTDVKAIYDTRPDITTDPQQWADYLNKRKITLEGKLKTLGSSAQKYNESGSASSSNMDGSAGASANAPASSQSRLDRLRGNAPAPIGGQPVTTQQQTAPQAVPNQPTQGSLVKPQSGQVQRIYVQDENGKMIPFDVDSEGNSNPVAIDSK